MTTVVEYGVNEVLKSGTGDNPFPSNFDTPQEAIDEGQAFMHDNPEVERIDIFQLTIRDDTIVSDQTLKTISRQDLRRQGLLDVQKESVVIQACKSIKAKSLKIGDWIMFANPRMNERVVDVQQTRDGQIKVHHDYGNGGEPATSFYEADDRVCVA
jgi:hypothetical protein